MRAMAVVLMFAFATGCHKSDVTQPEIVVTSPQQNQVFQSGQTVIIKASVTDEVGLHTVDVIAEDNTSGHWVHSEEHVDAKSFQISKTFTATTGKIYRILIDAIDHNDHNDNTVTREIAVYSN